MACPNVSGQFVKALQYCLKKLGNSIGLFPWIYLSLSLILCLGCSAGLLKIQMANDIRKGYTPDNSPSIQEWAVYKEFFQQKEPFSLTIFLQAKDRGSMLRRDYMDLAVDLNQHVMDECSVTINGTESRFVDLCEPYCQMNDVVMHFSLGLENQLDRQAENKSLSNKIYLKYPRSNILGQHYNLGPYFYGVNQSGDAWTKATTIDHVQLVLLHYSADRSNHKMATVLQEWEKNVEHCLKPYRENPALDVLFLHEILITDEVLRAGIVVMPYLVVGFAFMLIFATVTVLVSASYFGQMHWSKLTIGTAAVVSPMLAVGAGIGIMCYAGYKFGAIVTTVPFLVLAIGVDDAFLMIHSWQRLTASQEAHLTVSEKLGHTLQEVGPSITITSLTNALAFGIGAFTPTPDIRLFCTATAICITIDFVLELTIFGSVLALCGRFDNSCPISRGEKNKTFVGIGEKVIKALKYYCRLVQSPITAVIVTVFILIYAAVAVLGVCEMEASLTPKKLFLRDSPLIAVDALRERYIWNEYYRLTVFVNNPPHIENEAQMEHFMSMVEQFEGMEGGLGRNFTELWLLDYKKFHNKIMGCDLAFLDIECDINYDSLDMFMEWPEFIKWDAYVHWDRVNTTSGFKNQVSGFAFSISYKNMSSWTKRVELMQKWRALAESYPEFQVTPFEADAFLLDQIMRLKSITLQTVLITFASMALVCALFIPSVFSILFASLAIASISVGVLGLLSWWHTDLDPISMATTVMSIGFSVDFTAHVSFHYYQTGQDGVIDSSERIFLTLKAIAWPMVQAGVSTVLAVSALIFVDTYMAQVFIKTMVLVVGLGLLHGLLLLPSLLGALPSWLTGSGANCEQDDRATPSTSMSSGSSESGTDSNIRNPKLGHRVQPVELHAEKISKF